MASSRSNVPEAMEVSSHSSWLSEEQNKEEMEVSSPSSWLSEERNEEEEQGPLEKPLTSAEASAFASGSAALGCSDDGARALGCGGGNDDNTEVIEKEHMFDKVVTPSDVGKLNRLVIPKQHAEKYFPLDAAANEKGLLLSFEDPAGKLWRFRYSYWNSSQSYVMTKGWSRFVKEKRLKAGDTVSFCRGAEEVARDRLFIDLKRLADSRDPQRMPRLMAPVASPYGPWGGGAGGFLMPPAPPPPATLYKHHRFRQGLDINAATPARHLLFLGSAGMPPRASMPPPLPPPPPHNIMMVQPSPAVTAGLPMILDSVPLFKSPTAAGKREHLFGVNLDNQQWNRELQGSDIASFLAVAGMPMDHTQDTGNEEFLTSQYDNTVQSSQFGCRGRPWEMFKCCLHVVQFVVRIKARVRLQNSKSWRKDLKSDSFDVTVKVVMRQLDENVRRSTFTEEDSFYPRHSKKERVEKPHFTFHSDVKAWIAIKKQYGGLRHACTQQVADKLVGRNNIRQMIMEKLLLDGYGGSNYTVICINAGSGHGKTSLLRVLYNDQELMDAFDKSIWIQMSNKSDILMLYKKIIEFLMSDRCSITDISFLQEMVVEEIKDKKFVLFLDDADIEDQQFWSTVIGVLNTGAKGSAVIMAAWSSTISTFGDVATHSYFLNPLSEENNLTLLQQQAAVGTGIQSNPHLLMVAQRFISKFGGNPLNLKAIGGLLCHADSVSIERDKLEGSVIPLQLCHDVLPIHLKKCLAFCSLFPEGYIFDKHHIVLQWICHGCVRPVEGRELEDLGIEYFNELLCRSFFQYSPIHNDKDDKFVMHELMYKVVESVTRDKYYKSEDLLSSVPEKILHLSLVSSQFRTVELMSKTEELKDLQTFLVMQPQWQPYKISFPTLSLVGLDDFFLKFTSLETLDLSHTDTEELPGSIVGLRNLQYLSVSNTSIRALPSELCCLSNLQTLEAKNCRFLTELPRDTKKLIKLRHLDVTKDLCYVQLPQGVAQLTELRTLPVLHASSHPSHCSVSDLGNLQNLRGCLQLSGLENVKTGSKAEEANLKGKHHLKDLTLQWHDGGINIDDEDEDEDAENVAEEVLESLQPHTNLQELAIRGYEGSSFPAWMQGSSSLPNLVSLTLDSCCNCTHFPAIAQLPSLKFLGVRKMYDVKRLTNNTCGVTKFPSLELLNLWEMYGLEELFEASEGDCPRLRKLCISRCPDLKRLPCAPSLTELVLHCGHQLPDIPELESLVSLKIEGFHSVKSFGLPTSAALKKLEIRSCKELSSLEGLTALTSVQRLKVAGCPKLVLPRTDSLTS